MKNKRRGRGFTKFVILLALVAIVGFGAWNWLNGEIAEPHEHQAAGKIITIRQGTGSAEIISQLHREGVLKDELPAQIWLRFFTHGSKLKAGDYQFKSPITPQQVINKLAAGDVASRQFTIPEGYNQFDIAHVLASVQGLKQAHPMTEQDILELFKNTSLIADLDPQATTLEGYLFPDTYEFTATTTHAQLVEAMVKRFRKVYTPELRQRAAQLKLTTRQTVTLASLIEKEAKVDTERELISSVFHQRLKLGVPLACDPTIIYAALIIDKYRGKIFQSDLERDSPYNTYKHAGLPPGPIASPGKRSIQAALYPAQANYLYFVVDAIKHDGSHKFSASAAEHERAVQALRQAERGGK